MRQSTVKRETKETSINIRLDLDGQGKHKIHTGIGFFDHMLEAFALHSGIDLELECKGDLFVDSHHSIEDVGITLGSAFAKATENKEQLCRYGMASIPMDEALAVCNVDISGRPYLVFNGDFKEAKIGEMDTQMIKEFFYAFTIHAKVTLHINLMYGDNDHHKAEAIFKAFAHAIKMGVERREGTVLSTKGRLE